MRLSGVPAMDGVEARQLTGPVGGPFASFGAAFAAGDGFVRVGAEMGHLVMDVRARVDDRSMRRVDVSGRWLAAHVGAGFGW
jgi:hypothetical protein